MILSPAGVRGFGAGQVTGMLIRHRRSRLMRMVVGCACLLAMTSVTFGASTIDEGKAAYASGDYKTAVEKWRVLIEEGRPEGHFYLGVMYAEGKGVAQDYAKAFELYSEAAQKDHVPAQYNLANQYAIGEGAAQDLAKAEYWWTKAAERGLVPAQINLGNLYFSSVAGMQNHELARKWLGLAAQQGSAHAKELLARLEAETAQTPKPPEQPEAATRTAGSIAATSPAGDTPRREAWVLAQPAGHYTIQILAINADALARDYIQQHGLAERAAYIETTTQGAPVFRIVHGSYPSRELADKALAALPRAISANAPWVRTFAELHKLVDRRYAERGAR
jgi:septal ring-binding cell division protein DamX